MICLGNEQRSFFHFWDFWDCSQVLRFRLFVDYDGYSISSKVFLPVLVDKMIIWIKCIHFISLIPKMSMFTLTIFCLTTSNLPWFMNLIFQVPMHYCSLQHRTLLPSPVTSTTGHVFSLWLSLFFFLELFLHSSPVAYWAPTNLGSSSTSVISFCLFLLFMGLWRQECWCGLPFSQVLSELSTMTHPSWVALHGMAHSFLALDKAVVHVIRLVSVLWLWFSVCLPSDGEG